MGRCLGEDSKLLLGYKQKISSIWGLDLQIPGIDRMGHIGFNELGSATN
jgi:glucosamine-6-phosphate deaminase